MTIMIETTTTTATIVMIGDDDMGQHQASCGMLGCGINSTGIFQGTCLCRSH